MRHVACITNLFVGQSRVIYAHNEFDACRGQAQTTRTILVPMKKGDARMRGKQLPSLQQWVDQPKSLTRGAPHSPLGQIKHVYYSISHAASSTQRAGR